MTTPAVPEGSEHVFHQYTIRVPERERVQRTLSARGIATTVYYPVPLHRQECFASLGYAAGAFPESERAAAETLAIPIYPELNEAQQAEVARAVSGFYGAG